VGGRDPRPLTLDAGALIALEKADRKLDVLLRRAFEQGGLVFVPAGMLAQVWRSGARQARLASFLGRTGVTVEALTTVQAKAIGELCGLRGTTDVIDASVVLTARLYKGVVITSDPQHLRYLDPDLSIHTI
jgi:hypothetical protein